MLQPFELELERDLELLLRELGLELERSGKCLRIEIEIVWLGMVEGSETYCLKKGEGSGLSCPAWRLCGRWRCTRRSAADAVAGVWGAGWY